MTYVAKTLRAALMALPLAICFSGALSSAAQAQSTKMQSMQTGEERTVNRTVDGNVTYPGWIMNVPEHYEFLPLLSNHDAQNTHSAQWKGQEWDPTAWPAGWTPELAIKKFYDAEIFEDRYMKGGMPVLVTGPTFYKLSELDQIRTVKLVADSEKVLESGYPAITLQDWHTRKIVGSYTKQGLQLR